MLKHNASPLFRLALAACPALVVATTAVGGLTLGIVTGCVLVLSGIVAAALDNFVDERGRVALFLIVSAVFAGIAQMVMKALCAETAVSLGVYLPLVAVNCLLLTSPAEDNGVGAAASDGIRMALAFICLMTVLGAIREICDVGTVFGFQLLPKGTQISALAALPAGGLMLLGLLAGLVNALTRKRSGKEDEAA